jgi:lipoyl(octanoyl) transferase
MGNAEASIDTRRGAAESPAALTVRRFGLREYEPVWREMQAFNAARDAGTADEVWLVQHPPVYTVGLAGRPEHLPAGSAIPVIRIDRGGQITYHGPGQLVAYLLLDLNRRALGVRHLVRRMEGAVIDLLGEYGVAAEGRKNMPGVYVGSEKIAALGLRIRKGCCYHGLSLNIDMDLAPFAAIDPCGYPGLAVTQTSDLGISAGIEELGTRLVRHLQTQLAHP